MQGWWVITEWQQSPMLLIARVFWILFSVTLHELGHGWMALRLGDRTPVEMRRMTFNPLVHIGEIGLLVFALFGFAWGEMPNDPTRQRGRYAMAKVAVAGPVVNLLIAVLCTILFTVALLIAKARGITITQTESLMMFLAMGVTVNLWLAMLNLLPLPPLDGSKVLANFSRPYRNLIDGEHALLIRVVGMMAMLAIFGGMTFGLAAEITHRVAIKIIVLVTG